MSTMSEDLKSAISFIVEQIVDGPEAVDVSVVVSTTSVIIQISTKKEDCGKVIGKKGKTVSALKTIAMAVKNTKFPNDPRNVTIEILEDESTNYTISK